MSLLSKAEVQYLEVNKQVSKSYEYKLKSIIKRKISKLIEKDLPLLCQLFPMPDHTKISKVRNIKNKPLDLTKNSKTKITHNPTQGRYYENLKSNLKPP
jgi:hypothetical protein